MSKGWESKNVEEQQAEAAVSRPSSDRVAAPDDLERKRRIQDLELQRERVLSERTSSPHRRTALESALATIERDLQLLGWSIKL
jgi:hypothetical protein